MSSTSSLIHIWSMSLRLEPSAKHAKLDRGAERQRGRGAEEQRDREAEGQRGREAEGEVTAKSRTEAGTSHLHESAARRSERPLVNSLNMPSGLWKRGGSVFLSSEGRVS